jgi:hypothetical protein
LKRKLSVLLGSLMLLGCRGKDADTVQVAKHVFYVPKANAVVGTIPWLPKSQSEGMSFVVNPNAQLPNQILVYVQSADDACPPDSSPNPTLQKICVAAAGKKDLDPVPGARPRKEFVYSNDPTQWRYMARLRSGEDLNVASCTPGNRAGAGLCLFTMNYGDLLCLVSLNEIYIGDIGAVRRNIRTLMQSWEKNAPNH